MAPKELPTADTIPLLVAEVFELAGTFRQTGERIASEAGQTQARWQVLSAASAGPRTVAQIARRLGYARQSVQRTADQLSSDGLLRYRANPDHKKSALVELTADGATALSQITKAARKWHKALARHLEKQQLATTLEVLRRLCETAPNYPP